MKRTSSLVQQAVTALRSAPASDNMPRMRAAILGALCVLAAELGCSTVNQPAPATCVAGQQIPCGCPNGEKGSQSCKPDGSYDACVCSPAASSAVGSSSSVASTTGVGGMAGSSSSSGSAGSGGGGGAWTPKSLVGLALWLDADKGIVPDPQQPGAVLKWLDQSGNNNNATATGAGNSEHFILDPATLNGHQTIKCQGNGLIFRVEESSPSLQWGTGDFGVAVVFRPQVGFNSTLFKKYELNPSVSLQTWDQSKSVGLYIGGGPGLLQPYSDVPAFHIVVARGQAMRVSVDGAAATGMKTNVALESPPGFIVICSPGGDATTFEIAELVAVKGTVADADAAKLEAYFKAKFGL